MEGGMSDYDDSNIINSANQQSDQPDGGSGNSNNPSQHQYSPASQEMSDDKKESVGGGEIIQPSGENQDANQKARDDSAADQDPEDILDAFKDKLIGELGLGEANDEEKALVKEKIDTLVNDRILNLMLLYIPKEKAEELADKAEAGDEAKFFKFLNENIPGWGDKVFDELYRIRNEILGKLE